MAITTFAELKAAILSWTAKGSGVLTEAIREEFIALVESEVNELLRTADMETRATAVTVGGSERIATPTNFGGIRRLVITGDTGRPLEQVTPQYLDRKYIGVASRKPLVFSIEDGEFRFGPTPDAAYDLEVTYFKKVPALTVSNTTNWLLTGHPNVYRFGTLKEAWTYLMDEQRAAVFDARFQTAVTRLQNADRFNKWPGPLAMKHDYTV